MKVLLTGSSGQLGKKIKSNLRNDLEIISPPSSEFDLSKPNSLKKLIRHIEPNLIINSAAYTNVDNAEVEQDLSFLINSESPKIIAQEANLLSIPLVHISTDYVFDGSKEGLYLETDRPSPLNVYGESKFVGEKNVLECHDQAFVLRASWIYDSYGNNFLNTILRLLISEEEISVVKDQIGSPTSVETIVHTLDSVVARILDLNNNPKPFNYGIYHFCSEGSASWYDFAKKIKEHCKLSTHTAEISPILSSEYNYIAERPLNSRLSCNKIMKEFGVKQTDWKTQLVRVMSKHPFNNAI